MGADTNNRAAAEAWFAEVSAHLGPTDSTHPATGSRRGAALVIDRYDPGE
jgi:hypothetical protein